MLKEIVGKLAKIGGERGLNNGVVGLESLNNNVSGVEMPATNTTDDLGE